MNDNQLQREIEKALAVEPSPQFVTRVRQHLVHDTARRSQWLQCKVFAAGLAAAVLVAGVLLYTPSKPVRDIPVVPQAAVEEAPRQIPVAQTPSTNPLRRKTTMRKTSREPEVLAVLIDPREAAAFRSFLDDVQQRRIDPARLRELFDTAGNSRAAEGIQASPIAGLEPIEIPPLVPVAPEREGGSL